MKAIEKVIDKVLKSNVTFSELESEIGVTKEQLIRVLSKLLKDGIIAKDTNYFIPRTIFSYVKKNKFNEHKLLKLNRMELNLRMGELLEELVLIQRIKNTKYKR